MAENIKVAWLTDSSGKKVSPMTTASEVLTYDDSCDLKTKLENIDKDINLQQVAIDSALKEAKKYTDELVQADDKFSLSSTNPVQNKVVTEWLQKNVKQYVLEVNPDNGTAYLASSDSVLPTAGAEAGEDGNPVGARYIGNYPITPEWNNLRNVPSLYNQSEVDDLISEVKDDLLNGAGAAYDTLKELGDLIDDNKDAIQLLNDVAAGKADKTHDHAITDVIGLQTTLDGKLPTSTCYASSDAAGGEALYSKQTRISRITSNLMTDIAANLPVQTEAVRFGGSDATAFGCPTTYCIVNIKKGDNHRTILDCYHLDTGDHYINGNKDARVESTWTGWIKQPNAASINEALTEATSYADKMAGFGGVCFQNATITYADAPTDAADALYIYAGSSYNDHHLKFIAGNSIISFDDVTDDNKGGSVVVTVHADPEGSADAALEDAKTYTNSQIATVNADIENVALGKSLVRITRWEADD